MNVSVISLGCKVNQAEGENILAGFRKAGYETASQGETADVTVINTCTVTGEADRKSRKLIRKVVDKAATRGGLVIVTGCYAEMDEERLRQIPGVNLVVKQSEKNDLVRKVLHLLGYYSSERFKGVCPELVEGSRIAGSQFAPTDQSGLTRTICSGSRLTSRSRVYLKIQDGCDNNCAYCIVPTARGRSRSVTPAAVEAKAVKLAASGIKEIVLTGINIGKYPDLPGLIDSLLTTPGLSRLRLSSIEPEDVTPQLIELLTIRPTRPTRLTRSTNPDNLAGPKRLNSLESLGCLTNAYLCPHLHIPLQSGDDTTLREMGRTYTSEEYAALVKRVRAACPGVAITTDLIVGLPGETEERFQNTIQFLEDVRPARLHVFKYSKRPGTPAAACKDQVPEKVKTERSETVRGLGEKLAAEYRREFVGHELDVLIEKANGKILTGTSENYLSVSFEGESGDVGRIVRVKLA